MAEMASFLLDLCEASSLPTALFAGHAYDSEGRSTINVAGVQRRNVLESYLKEWIRIAANGKKKKQRSDKTFPGKYLGPKCTERASNLTKVCRQPSSFIVMSGLASSTSIKSSPPPQLKGVLDMHKAIVDELEVYRQQAGPFSLLEAAEEVTKVTNLFNIPGFKSDKEQGLFPVPQEPHTDDPHDDPSQLTSALITSLSPHEMQMFSGMHGDVARLMKAVDPLIEEEAQLKAELDQAKDAEDRDELQKR